MLYRFERTSVTWKSFPSIPVMLGKKGLAWGRGKHLLSEGPQKTEGDLKSPAGIFSLGPVFGSSSHRKYACKMPFLLIVQDLECVDDPHSRYYNRFVHAYSVPDRDWKSSEKMAEIGFLYSLGVVIENNTHPIEAGSGSCIFMHISDMQKGTAGCTAMEEKDLIEVVSWLDEKKKPILVQLAEEEYAKKQRIWDLPNRD